LYECNISSSDIADCLHPAIHSVGRLHLPAIEVCLFRLKSHYSLDRSSPVKKTVSVFQAKRYPLPPDLISRSSSCVVIQPPCDVEISKTLCAPKYFQADDPCARRNVHRVTSQYVNSSFILHLILVYANTMYSSPATTVSSDNSLACLFGATNPTSLHALAASQGVDWGSSFQILGHDGWHRLVSLPSSSSHSAGSSGGDSEYSSGGVRVGQDPWAKWSRSGTQND